MNEYILMSWRDIMMYGFIPIFQNVTGSEIISAIQGDNSYMTQKENDEEKVWDENIESLKTDAIQLYEKDF